MRAMEKTVHGMSSHRVRQSTRCRPARRFSRPWPALTEGIDQRHPPKEDQGSSGWLRSGRLNSMAYIVSRKNRFYVVAYDGIDPVTNKE